MRKVLIPTKLDSIANDLLTQNNFEVIQDSDTDYMELIQAHSDVSALIVRSEPVNAKTLEYLPQLKVIIRAGAGYNTIDIKQARRLGVDVMNTPGANANAVAEEVITMILASYRHVIPADESTRKGLWEKKKFMGKELTSKTVGVIGLGNIGQLVIKRMSGFECTILGYDPVISPSKAEALGVELTSLDAIFEKSDVVTLHIPESSETRGIVNKKYLSQMKPGAILVNCARAGILNEDDLRSVKKEKKIIYCNDVYAKDEAGVKSITDVADLMLPHLGASTEEANFNAAKRAAEQLISYVEQGVRSFVVNKAIPEGLSEDYQLLAFYLGKISRSYLGCGLQPDRIEASFYGGLDQFSNWLMASVVSGVSSDFDPMFDFQDASDYLKEKGITFTQRYVDDSKGYGKSMTVDLFQGSGNSFSKVSIRGTVTEGNPMISRIDGFDKLYFEPKGMSVLATYEDQPGMLAKITSVIAKHTINIIDIRCPYDPKSGESIAILKVNKVVNQDILDEVLHNSGARKAVFSNIK